MLIFSVVGTVISCTIPSKFRRRPMRHRSTASCRPPRPGKSFKIGVSIGPGCMSGAGFEANPFKEVRRFIGES